MTPSKKDAALTKLNLAIVSLPEYRALVKLLGHNEIVSACTVVEQEVTVQPTPNVSYEGITSTPKKGEERPYLLTCCGQEYFRSSKSIEELSKDIQEAVNNTPKGKDPDMHTFHISSYLSDKLGWDKTDEVYPHMRMEAVGTFSVIKL
jgi:hypothetical protein